MQKEYTFSLSFSNGSTQSLIIRAWDKEEAISKIQARYINATINWII